MDWRELLTKLGIGRDPLQDVLAVEATKRDGTVDRRTFLTLVGATAAGVLLDTERVLWTPGEKVIVEAKTLEDAIAGGFSALYKDGTWYEVVVGKRSPTGESIESQLLTRVREVEAEGGRIVRRIVQS